MIELVEARGRKEERKSLCSFSRSDRLVDSTDALGGKTHHDYDGFDRLLAITSPVGTRTVFERDAAGRVTRETVFGENPETGNFVRCRETEHGYDERGLLISETLHEFDLEDSATERLLVTRLYYDSMGRLRRRTNPDGSVQESDYDALGRLSSAE